MRALVINCHDRFNGLEYAEVETPSPADGEVSINVNFAGVGLIDALWTTGRMPSQLGRIPGLEVSGTIRELGAGVTDFTVGQRVAAILPNTGGFAEVVCTPASLVAEVPNALAMDLASVVPINIKLQQQKPDRALQSVHHQISMPFIFRLLIKCGILLRDQLDPCIFIRLKVKYPYPPPIKKAV